MREAANNSNGARISIRNKPSKTDYTLELRVYNDGSAFRFIVPEPGNTDSRYPDEASAIKLPAGSTDWFHD